MVKVGDMFGKQENILVEVKDRFAKIADSVSIISGIVEQLDTSSNRLYEENKGVFEIVTDISKESKQSIEIENEIMNRIESENQSRKDIAIASEGLVIIDEKL